MTIDGSDDLAKTMYRINKLEYESSAVNRYATFFFAILDPVTLEMQYVNAGHNPPMLVRGDGSATVRLEAGGTVVGRLPDVTYQSASATMQAGDILVCFTDGISEAMDTAEEEWSEERMLDAVRKTPNGAAEAVLREVFQAADHFTGEAPQHDDMTLLIVRVKS
jgi:sigma-B regulation protein RsbU (phosphoserine phosphatase)